MLINILKLNILSVLYVLVYFIPVIIYFNFYRIQFITKMTDGILLVVIACIVLLITIIFIFTIKKVKKNIEHSKYNSALILILWFPYLILFINLYHQIFPELKAEEEVGAGSGILVLFLTIFYFLILMIVELLNLVKKDK